MTIDIRGIDKAELLVALFTAANPPTGMGAINYSAADTLTVEEATDILRGETFDTPYTGQPMHLDYVKGRNLKIDLAGNELDDTMYDSIHGDGAAQRAVNNIGNAYVNMVPINDEHAMHTSVLPDGATDRFYAYTDPSGIEFYYE